MGDNTFINLVGQKFGKLTVLSESSSIPKYRSYNVLCDCGNHNIVLHSNLRNGTTKSCGCIRRQCARDKFKTHGKTKSKTYSSWASMKTRCTNPLVHQFRLYGGIGITVCERWNSFENFLEDMGERPNGMSIDRIDSNGNYEPSNCKWSTQSEQAKNRRKIKLFNKERFKNFLQSQNYLTEEQRLRLADNFMEWGF